MARVKYTKELLEEAAKNSTSIAQVIRKLGLKEAGGTHTHISRKLREFEIDTSHFLGQGANRGSNKKGGPRKKTWQEVLVKKDSGTREKSYQLRRALLEFGRDYVCSECGQEAIWNGKPLMLQVDHVNGDWLDNTPPNLRFLCGHCHSQTDNWCGSQGFSEIDSTALYNREVRKKKRYGSPIGRRR